MSPLFIRLALAYYQTDFPNALFPTAHWKSPEVQSCRHQLHEAGLIDDEDQPTEKLKFWVRHLCSIPLPVESYKIPERGK